MIVPRRPVIPGINLPVSPLFKPEGANLYEPQDVPDAEGSTEVPTAVPDIRSGVVVAGGKDSARRRRKSRRSNKM
jgi:hypothetical protein